MSSLQDEDTQKEFCARMLSSNFVCLHIDPGVPELLDATSLMINQSKTFFDSPIEVKQKVEGRAFLVDHYLGLL